ncbi:MAG: hydroxymethylbilane synthase [Candidatus Hydrogenedentota bacterium]
MKRIVIGTRGSILARTQSEWIAARLREADPGCEVTLKIIKTTGDKIQDVALSKIGGKGLFTKEIEAALLAGEVDLAVHSLKDLPTELPAGLALGAVPVREWPLDALVSRGGRTLDTLPKGAKVGTSSLRRRLQLRAHRPDIEVTDLRGNVPTRVRKVQEGPLDAAVLAAAGLRRLGREDDITQLMAPEIMLPAPAQGALGIEIREDDVDMRALLRHIHAPEAAAEVTAERTLLEALGGGCQVPVGALARAGDATGTLTLTACVCSPDETRVLRAAATAPATDAARLGRDVAASLLEQGAGGIIHAVTGAFPGAPLRGTRIVITRARRQAERLGYMLETRGATVFEFPTIEIRPPDDAPFGGTPCAVDWLVFTSRNAVDYFARLLARDGRSLDIYQTTKIAVVGPGTAEAAQSYGLPIALMPDEHVGEGLAGALMARENSLEGKHILLPRGDKARPYLRDALRESGAVVTDIVVYHTRAPEIPEEMVTALFAFDPDIITFTSSSTCANFCARLTTQQLDALKRAARFASIGPKTTKTARSYGLAIDIEAASFDLDGFVAAIEQEARK